MRILRGPLGLRVILRLVVEMDGGGDSDDS